MPAEGGMGGDAHEVSILIRDGDGGRAGRTPSKVSTTIMRPPQQGHRRAGEGVNSLHWVMDMTSAEAEFC